MDRRGSPIVVWFRDDLRVAENPALQAAAATGRPVVPLYVFDDAGPPRRMGAASKWWLDKSLRALGETLRKTGSPLVLRRGDALETLTTVVAETGATGLAWNRLYDRKSIDRDQAVASAMAKLGVATETHNASLINEPDAVRTGAGGAFKVFTPYFRAALGTADVSARASPTPILHAPERPPHSEALSTWSLHPSSPDWSAGFGDWTPGEAGARARLDHFLDGAAKNYAHGRNIMGEEGVSRLSPHLHFGEIGPRQVWRAVRAAAEHGHIGHGEAETFQKELLWREFNHSLLFHNPDITHRPFNAAFATFDWLDDRSGFRAWTKGLTGYPVVDAAMRQLWTTGWMHNRARMVAASFLVKDLLVDWRRGEAWFWNTLVDADLANNVCNWQWVAGSGADAAPFFRIFNPTLQGAKFDALGRYVRRWVPELAALSDRDLHEPWKADPAALTRAGVELGLTYPTPIVDHSAARDRALAAYARVT
jgi:deoxyribodipyrimidine photo-lyase